ncbi:sensor histidine kinase [Coraliomargarita sinensis]|nr:HAMP domain-containing sensor histidine kinase [Coraliomargarita sinensis]
MPAYLVFFTFYVTASAWVLFKGFKEHLGQRASDCFFVLGSGVIGFAGGSTNFPLWYDIPIQPYGNILTSVYIVIVGYGLYSKKISGISLDFYKALSELFLNLSVALFYVIGYGIYMRISGEDATPAQLWIHGIGSFLVSYALFWLIPKAKYWTTRIVDTQFRQAQVDALESLKALPTELSDISDVNEIFKLVGDSIADALEVYDVSIYIEETFSNDYECVYATRERFEELGKERVFSMDPLAEVLSKKPDVIVLDRIHDVQSSFYASLVDLKHQMDVSVIVPVFAGHDLYGLIFIGQPRQSKTWNDEEVSALFNIGAQVGLNIRVRELERRSSEIDKLVALGTMAAGLSHEIRNPLVSVQTMTSMIKKGSSANQINEEFKQVLIRDVKRIENIVEGVALYSRNQKVHQVPIRIDEVIATSMELVEAKAREKEISIQYRDHSDVEISVRANYDQLTQVFHNLLENALDALLVADKNDKTIQIEKRIVTGQRKQAWVEISISDNGVGIPKNILSRIFDPFTTSKDTGRREDKSGMGLGLAISKRIIDNHDGAINARNNADCGAVFVVSLPVKEN